MDSEIPQCSKPTNADGEQKNIVMKKSTQSKQKRILAALLAGMKITPREANDIGGTTDGTRYIRRIRTKYPVKDERVEGHVYHRYWIDEEYLAN